MIMSRLITPKTKTLLVLRIKISYFSLNFKNFYISMDIFNLYAMNLLKEF